MIVDKKLSLILMCFELPRKLEVCEIQSQILSHWPDFIVRVVRTVAA